MKHDGYRKIKLIDLLRHIRILSILRAHFGLIRCIHRQINARGRLAYRLVIAGKYA